MNRAIPGVEELVELTEIYGRGIARLLLMEALASERPAAVLAEFLAEYWAAAQGQRDLEPRGYSRTAAARVTLEPEDFGAGLVALTEGVE
jgi:hypothetical protein